MARGALCPWAQKAVELIEATRSGPWRRAVLALVLLPGTDDEHLLEEITIGQITMQMPVRRPGATPDAAKLGRPLQKRLVIARRERIGHGDHDRHRTQHGEERHRVGKKYDCGARRRQEQAADCRPDGPCEVLIDRSKGYRLRPVAGRDELWL
jgi:hypothetical protein